MRKIVLFTLMLTTFGCAPTHYYGNIITLGPPEKIENRNVIVLLRKVTNGYSVDVDIYSYCSDIIPESANEKQAQNEIAASLNFQLIHTRVPKNGEATVVVMYSKSRFVRLDQIYCLHFRPTPQEPPK